MNRAERRRAAVVPPGSELGVAPTPSLKTPGHWHANAVAFSHEDGGTFMNAIHIHNVATNDLVLFETFVLKTVKPLNGPVRDRMRTEEVVLCIDPTHLDTAQPELIKDD